MKAIRYFRYGSPDVLEMTEVEKPVPNDNQVLVKIHASSANPVDWHRMRGQPFLVRLGDGLRQPKNPKIGADMAGTVEAVGSSVTQFKPGDEVYGCVTGAFAEYICARETSLALKPTKLSFEEAASIPVVAFTAIQGLRDTGKMQSGQKVLINGASGGVGTFALQYAKSYGNEVTAVCSTRNIELVRSLGADHVIDYTTTNFTRTGQQYDLIYDAVGNHSVFALRRALKPGGICSITGFNSLPGIFAHIVIGGLVSKYGDRQIGLMGIAKPNQADLLLAKDLLETRKVVPVID